MIQRLYDLFKPSAYQLKLDIDSEDLKFNGSVTIAGSIEDKSRTIKLHSKELDILSCTVNGQEVTFSIDKKIDVLKLESEKELSGPIEVSVKFKAKITDAMHGMYPCYFEHEGEKKKLIATQFESHHAREVFPCVDEPAAKATFDVELITAEGEAVLSNMPVLEQSLVDSPSSLEAKLKTKDQRLKTAFETSPVMSTYLLAFVCGEMVSKEAKTRDGVIVKSWATVAQDPAWLDYSVSETIKLIEFYNEYFHVPYPLAKCDQVALPDFDSAAMENWGLITYRETVLLSDPKNPSLSTQQLITIVIAHELSHQWFGNLVTMQWWDDLWLNESFANMTEYLAADRLHPEWKIWEEFVATDVISATNRDVYKDVQAVRVEVNNPEEIHTLFDPSIVYAKGGKLLKMLHDLLGDDTWRAGLKQYFEKHAYKNTTRDDLWDAFSSVSDLDVPALMNAWIERPGQPLVTMRQEKTEATLSQKRFSLDGAADGTIWQVPLLSKNAPMLLEEKQAEITLQSDEFTLLNESGVGHYITNYELPEHKKWVASQITAEGTPSEWKISYLNGLVMLCRHGDANLDEALEATKNTDHESRAAVWSQIGNVIGSTRTVVEGDEELDSIIKKLNYSLSTYHRERLGWQYPEDEPSNNTHLRTTILSLSISSENDAVIQKALEMYGSTKNPEDLPAEIRSMLMGVAVRFGEESEFERLIGLYTTSSNADFKTDICAALCSTKKPEQAKQLTKMMLDTEIVRTQDTIRWYIYLLRNRYVRDIAWDWLVNNWDWIMEQFGGSKSYDDYARYSATLFNSDEHLRQYKDFFEPKASDPSLKRAIAIGINEITAKSEWRKRDLEPVTQWLKDYQSSN